MTRVIALLLFTSLLAGCGFHLRGQGDIDDAFRTVDVRDAGTLESSGSWFAGGRDELHNAVTRAFEDGGYRVSDSAPVVVELLAESIQRRIASIDASASAAEYQVDYALRFRIKAGDGAVLVPEATLNTDRSYRYHENAVMGSAEEEATLYREMRRDVAAQVVRQYRRSTSHRPAPAAPVDAPAAPADAPAP